MRTFSARTAIIPLILAAFGTPLSVSAQAARPGEGIILAAQQAPAATTQVRRLSADEAVRLAAENNLGIQIARYDPQIQDTTIVQARAGWTPSLVTSLQQNSQVQAPNSFLAGGGDGFAILLEGTDRLGGDLDLDAMVAYMGANTPVAPPLVDRITVVNAPPPAP